MKKYTCPCCGYKTHLREDSQWDICSVCFWQNDVIDPLQQSGANNGLTLAQAQQHFILFGACEKRFLATVRLPFDDEIKDEDFQTHDEKVAELRYFKRHWGESTGNVTTNDWGVCTYYLAVNEKGEVLKQIEIYANGKLLKYSNLYKEDEFGGLAEAALVLTEPAYQTLKQSTFYNVWNIPIIEKFAENKLRFLGWYLPIYQEKIIYPNPEFKEDEKLVVATLDNRFALELSYHQGGDHFPRNGFFLLKIDEGHTGIHYFNYMTWDEAAAATQLWIDEVQEANKRVDARKEEEARIFEVRVNIDNQIVMSKITTWRNMDWQVEKFRNIQIEIKDETYSVINTFTEFETMLNTLQGSLPENYKIETCFFCRFSSYSVYGNDNFGTLICYKNHKEEFIKATCKDEYLDVQMQSDDANFVEETHHCEAFLRAKKGDWVFKNQCED